MDEISRKHITTAEAAQILGVSTRSVQLYAKQGKLTSRKGAKGENLFLLEEIDDLAKEREMTISPSSEVSPKVFAYDPEKQVVISKEHFAMLSRNHEETLRHVAELGFRIGQLEEEKRRLLEDRRPWWKKIFGG